MLIIDKKITTGEKAINHLYVYAITQYIAKLL